MEPSVMKAQNAQFVWACIATCHICKSSYIATMFMTDDNLLANTAQFTFYYCTCMHISFITALLCSKNSLFSSGVAIDEVVGLYN